MDELHELASINIEDVGVWLPGDEGFEALLGTDNGKCILWLVCDAAKSLQQKSITAIYTKYDGRSNAINWMAARIGLVG
jgi:hypothetical protein